MNDFYRADMRSGTTLVPPYFYLNNRIRSFLLLLIVIIIGLPAAAQENPVTPESLAEPDGQFASVNGAQIYYIRHGPADGPHVLLLHGFLGSTDDWSPVIDVLAEAGYRVIAFDSPPFGLSDKATGLDYSVAGQAALTLGLMDALGIERAALVGHSAGGAVAAQAALDSPDRVTHLLLVSAAIGLEEGSGEPPDFGPLSFITEADPDDREAQAQLRDLVKSPLLQIFAGELVGRDMFQLEGWEGGLLAFVRDNLNATDPLEPGDLTGLDIPVTLIWGEGDQIVPVEVGKRLRAALPDARWITYAEAGHMVMQDATDAFNVDLLAILKGA
jgi:pimeloyl-ACP methyl ester carboxylesterase